MISRSSPSTVSEVCCHPNHLIANAPQVWLGVAQLLVPDGAKWPVSSSKSLLSAIVGASAVLKAIETARAQGSKPPEVDAVVKEATRKYLGGDLRTIEARREDELGHHIVRLAYCQSEEKRKWFLAHECMLFRWRLERQTPEQVSEFMQRAQMKLERVDAEEREAVIAGVRAVWMAQPRPSGMTEAEWERQLSREPIFKVPFTQALELVASRRAFLAGGYAYVPRERLTHIILGRFRSALSRGLVQAAKALPAVLRDERLGPVLGNMAKAYLGPQYGQGGVDGAAAGEEVKATAVSGLSRTSFPLCMSGLQRAIVEHSHLKHAGRMQYGLFLKGIGLSLEEAMVFWQGHFTKRMTGEEFIKQYAYNIRHNYGKEGKRADYTPYSCTKIIMGTPPGAGEFHGCPYRHWDQAGVRRALLGRGLSAPQVESVMESVSNKHYQIACRREFEHRMGLEDDRVGQHPNGYFEACQRVIRGKADAGAEAEPAAASSSAAAAAESKSAVASLGTTTGFAAASGSTPDKSSSAATTSFTSPAAAAEA